MAGSEAEKSTCGTVGCQRDPVVVYQYAPGTDEVDREITRLCLQCRRVVSFASGIPWGDTSEDWIDKHALREYNENNNVVKKQENYTEPLEDRA